MNEFLEEMEALVQGDESLSELGEGEEEGTVRLWEEEWVGVEKWRDASTASIFSSADEDEVEASPAAE